MGDFQGRFCILFCVLTHSFDIYSHSLNILLARQEFSDSLCIHPASDLESADVPLCGGWYLQTKIWVSGMFVAIRIL